MTIMLDDKEFSQLLNHLERSWAGYRKVRKGVKKRVRRHMEALGCKTVEPYIRAIDTDSSIRAACEELLAVTISRFFRDQRMWEQLQDRFWPRLARRFGGTIHAWSAGCASGEEPYSLAIMCETQRAQDTRLPKVQILATDANRTCLERAIKGIYAPSSLKEVSDQVKHRWFQKVPGKKQWQIDEKLRQRIDWRFHQLLDPPPRGTFHLILLRNNLLTYYTGRCLDMAFKGILGALADGGLLIVGSHEQLPAQTRGLRRSGLCPWIYTKSINSPDSPKRVPGR